MNSKQVFPGLLLLFLAIRICHADIISKVLQNGHSGYEGCEDTYIIVKKGFTGDTADYLLWHDNFSTDSMLTIANRPS